MRCEFIVAQVYLCDKNAEMNRPASTLTDAVQAYFNETHGDLMQALLLTSQIRVELSRKQYLKYEAVDKRYRAFNRKRDKDRIALLKEKAQISTPDERTEYISHLLAVVETHSETMAELAKEFNDVIRSYRSTKKKSNQRLR